MEKFIEMCGNSGFDKKKRKERAITGSYAQEEEAEKKHKRTDREHKVPASSFPFLLSSEFYFLKSFLKSCEEELLFYRTVYFLQMLQFTS